MSAVDFRLLKARELLETALSALTDAIEKKEKGEPLEAGRRAAEAARLGKNAVEVIESTAKPHN